MHYVLEMLVKVKIILLVVINGNIKESDANVHESYLSGYLVDGVLNNEHTRTVTHDGWCFVDDYLVERLGRLVHESGAKIVLSSTWREGWCREDASLNEPFFNDLRDKLKSYDMEIWDALPLPMCPRRSQAIQAWFDGHRDLDIESYVILDDWHDMDQFSSHFVWTNPCYGIRDEDVTEALRILDNKI